MQSKNTDYCKFPSVILNFNVEISTCDLQIVSFTLMASVFILAIVLGKVGYFT